MRVKVIALLTLLSLSLVMTACEEIDALLGIESIEQMDLERVDLEDEPIHEEEDTVGLSHMGEIIYSEIAQMNTSFKFTHDRRVTPREVLDEVRTAMQGSYYWGIIGGDINAEVTTREQSNTSEVVITVEYIHTREEEAVLEAKSDEITASIIETGMSDSDKIKAIYDYIVLNAEYATNGTKTENGISVHSPYALIRDGRGVCQAYALLNYKLLEKSGIDVIYITGQASNGERVENHAWNLVYTNGQWHHSDPTWGDPVPDVRGRVLYDYYMKNDTDFRETHSWDENLYPRAGGRF